MDIYRYLHNDYRDISDMMEQLLAMRVAEHRQELFRTLRQALLLHMGAVERSFYAALAEDPQLASLLRRSELMHEAMKAYLGKLSSVAIDGRAWLEEFIELRHVVSQYVKEAESTLFSQAKERLSRAQEIQLAKDMETIKREQTARAA